MNNPELFALPLLVIVVFFGDYWINTVDGSCARKSALHEASWWGGAFLIFGILNGLLLLG